MKWKYVLVLSFALFAATQIIGFASGVSFGTNWTMYGDSVEEAAANSTLVRRAVIAIVAFPMYLTFFHLVRTQRLRNLAAVFLAIGTMNLAFDVFMGSPIQEAIRWAISPTQLAVGLLALATSMLLLRPKKTSEATR